MRKFENFVTRKVEDNNGQILFIDLAFAEITRGIIEITVGMKEKVGGNIGTTWVNRQTDVEDNFSIQEFEETCAKFEIPCTAFQGDSETYIL